MGPRIVPVFQTADEFIRSYRYVGIFLAIASSALTMVLAVSVPGSVTPPWFYLAAVPVSYVIAWFIVHQVWSMDPELQKKANCAFITAYFHVYPVAYALSAVVTIVSLHFDLV